jgi:1,4-dihydroxy-6-naphthoate synthase
VSKIRVAHSPDSDDAFMFYALAKERITTSGLHFVFTSADTEALNAMADRRDGGDNQPDVLAISIARYPAIADRWLLLPHGMSVGRGYGPVVVANRKTTLAELAGKRIGVPGLRTTAHLVLRLVGPAFEPVVIPIAPFERVFEALRSGEVDAAVLIHEGRLTYEREGFALAADLGATWQEQTGLPLPLGGNVIARDLGPEVIARVSRACRASIAWALEHKEEVVTELLRKDARLERSQLEHYLDLYANSDTAGLQDDVRRGVELLLEKGAAAGLIPRVSADYAP